VDYGHSKKVEMGFYLNGCACANHGNKRGKGSPQQDYAGDVTLLHDMNFDAAKFDNCGGQRNLTKYAELMKASGKNFSIENCHWGQCSNDDASSCPSHEWAPFNFFRSSSDINSDQMSWFENLQTTIRFSDVSQPGCWANPDMLEVGRVGSTTDGGHTGVPGWSFNRSTQTIAWNRAHFGAWCVSSAPLVLGADLTKLSDELVDIISNDEAITINQQWSGHPGTLLRNISNGVQIWHKPQPNGTMAVLVINALNSSVNATITLAELNMTGSSSCAVRDVWRHQDLGHAISAVSTEVGPTDSQFLLLAPLKTKS
jgi:alpha-galactosidase